MAGGTPDRTEPQALDFRRTVWPLERYRRRHADSIADIRRFWEPIARSSIIWRRPFSRVLDWNPPFAKWFPDGTLNASENCLDRHLRTPVADRAAYIWEG